MARVLIVTVPFTRGDVNPYLVVTRRLRREGHDVFWLSMPEDLRSFAPLVTEAGATIVPSAKLPHTPYPRGAELAAIMGDPPQYARMMRIVSEEAEEQLAHARAVLRDIRPNVVAADRLLELHPMMLAANLERVPHACVLAGLAVLVRRVASNIPEAVRADFMAAVGNLRALFERHGVTPTLWENQFISPTLNTVFTTEAFVGDVPMRPEIALVGPCIEHDEATVPDFPMHRLRDDGRVVYVSFGSLYADSAAYRVVAEAASTLDVQLVVSSASLGSDAEIRDLPGDVIVAPYVPQLAVLARSAVSVTHGGLNSVTEALYHGVPLLVADLAMDQWMQASFIRKNGAGIALEREERSVPRVREALATLLDRDGTQRAAAARIRDSFRAKDGAAEVARRLLALASAG